MSIIKPIGIPASLRRLAPDRPAGAALVRRLAAAVLGLGAGAVALSGCATAPLNSGLLTEGRADLMNEVMARNNRIVELSEEADRRKPLLLLLHGATPDPTEMLDIGLAARGRYRVLLYTYNFHEAIQKVAAELDRELSRIKAQATTPVSLTVITYSYSAILFHQAVIAAEDPHLFDETWVIQMVPTAGGSFLARWMSLPGLAWLVSLASNPSVAENPYGRFARHLWGEAGTEQFNKRISPDRVRTILLEGDHHSLARLKNPRVRTRYLNGIGPNVVVIPKSFGVDHDYLPENAIALEYVRTLLEPPPALGRSRPDVMAVSRSGAGTASPPISPSEQRGGGAGY